MKHENIWVENNQQDEIIIAKQDRHTGNQTVIGGGSGPVIATEQRPDAQTRDATPIASSSAVVDLGYVISRVAGHPDL